MRRVRGYGHNRPALLTTELAHRLLEQVERAADVDRKGLLPVLLRKLIRRAHTQNARRVNQHVEPLKAAEQTPADITRLRRIRHVQRFGGKRIFAVRESQIEPGHLRPGLHKCQRGRIANALTRARHPDGFTGKIKSHHFTSRESSAHQASRVGFFASITKSMSPCTLRQRAASAIIRTESRP